MNAAPAQGPAPLEQADDSDDGAALASAQALDVSGCLRKMPARVRADTSVAYQLALQERPEAAAPSGAESGLGPIRHVALNPWIGRQFSIEFLGAIHCVHCGRKTSKSFNQGYCYPCFKRLARCDLCVLRPHTCHYDQGTCREEAWGREHCMTDHIVYLANTSGLKAGITRASQVPTRWLDQGAVQALPIIAVRTRLQSGLVEVLLHRWIKGTTHWRAMLGEVEAIDLPAERERALALAATGIAELQRQTGLQAVQTLADEPARAFRYPVRAWPEPLRALRLDKQPIVSGQLLGIKGQYLLFDCGVLNVRSSAGYWVRCRAG